MGSGRDEAGRFANGNTASVGHGRPKRPTEAAFMRAFSDELALADWRAIVRRAIDEAKDGDSRAREWLARYALGDSPLSLMELAMRDELELSDADELQHAIREATISPVEKLERWGGSDTPIASMLNAKRGKRASR